MAFWREDVIDINGFNEEFLGWGREDSEFAARMQNAGIKRINFKFGAIAYHLYHPEHTRARLAKNDELLEQTLQQKKIWCEKGVSQYL
jgi:GT2 family glycosyltransferase